MSIRTKGYLKLARWVMDDEIYIQPYPTFRIFEYLLMKVFHTDGSKYKRGEGFFKIRQIAEDTGFLNKHGTFKPLSERTVRRCLDRLEEMGVISRRRVRRGLIITVCDYDRWIESDSDPDTIRQSQTPDSVTLETGQIAFGGGVSKCADSTNRQSEKPQTVTDTYIEKNVRIQEENTTLSEDNGEHGNPNVNFIISALEGSLGHPLDGSKRDNRLYAWNLFRKVRKVSDSDQKALDLIGLVIEIGMDDPFHSRNLTSVRYLYYNFARIGKSKQADEVVVIS